MDKEKLKDPELGTIIIRTNTRARHYNLRVSDGIITATIPLHGDKPRLLNFIEEKRPWLRSILKKSINKRKIWDESSRLQTHTFRVHIFRTDRSNFYMKLDGDILQIACPQETDFTKEQVQKILSSFIERALRHEANRILPGRLEELAKKYNFTYNDVKITKSKSRWGSCSSKKTINLSLSLMLLPQHLIDYVLLHELCHTIEMNHSVRFWNLMNQVTHYQALHLRNELKNFSVHS